VKTTEAAALVAANVATAVTYIVALSTEFTV